MSHNIAKENRMKCNDTVQKLTLLYQKLLIYYEAQIVKITVFWLDAMHFISTTVQINDV